MGIINYYSVKSAKLLSDYLNVCNQNPPTYRRHTIAMPRSSQHRTIKTHSINKSVRPQKETYSLYHLRFTWSNGTLHLQQQLKVAPVLQQAPRRCRPQAMCRLGCGGGEETTAARPSSWHLRQVSETRGGAGAATTATSSGRPWQWRPRHRRHRHPRRMSTCATCQHNTTD